MNSELKMIVADYIRSRGVKVKHVAQLRGVTRQDVEKLGVEHAPKASTLKWVADAMTQLGAPTTLADITKAVYKD